MVGISFDPVPKLERAAAQLKVMFPLLSDEGSKTIDAYAIRNREVPKSADGIPHPMTFVLDQDGVIRAKLFHEGYRQRHTSADLIEAIGKISRR